MNSGTDPKKLERRVGELERELAARRTAEEALEKELKRFRGLYDLAIALTTDQDLDENLQLIVDKSRELLGTDISYIALQDEERGDYYKHSMSGIRTEEFKRIRLPPGKGLGGMVVSTGRGLMVEDYFGAHGLDRLKDKALLDEGIVSGMAVPIQMRSKNLGVLYTFNRIPTRFSQDDLDTLFLIANLASVEITRKEAEASLRESEERFRFMAETTGDVIYRLRYDSMSYDYLSPGIQKLTGYTPEETKALGFGKLVRRIDLPGEEDISPEKIARDRREGKTGEYRADYHICTRQGILKWVRDHSFPWLDESGGIVGSVGILSDITDYKRIEARIQERTLELIESEEKYRTLVENVPLVVYRINTAGGLIFVNQFVEELFGYAPAEILKNPALWSEMLYDEDRTRICELRERTYREGSELLAEYRVVHRNGHLVYVADHAISSPGPSGLTASIDGIVIDVTGRVKLQDELVRAEGHKMITEISARLAHEFRNPLVCAGGFARRLFCSMNPDDPNRDKVEIIVKQVGRLEAILRMLLHYIQPLELKQAPAQWEHLVGAVLRDGEIESGMSARDLHVDLHFQSGLRDLLVDPLKTEQVLKTLVRNALTQMPNGAALSMAVSDEEGFGRMVLRYPVRHLSQDDAAHFFFPFTTFKEAYPDADLPMCKVIVGKHGGSIDVRLERSGELVIHMKLPHETGKTGRKAVH